MIAQILKGASTLVGVWLETLAFGIYFCLFVAYMSLLCKRKGKLAFSTRIFMLTAITMFITATLHISLGLIRLLNGYVYTEDKKALEKYWRSKAWEHSAYTIVGTVMAWQGQVLLIYRCYLVWEKRWLVVIPSIMMFLASFAVGLLTNILWTKPGGILKYARAIDAGFPLTFCQIVWTTGLIVWRLVRMQALRKREGSSSRINLKKAGIIVLESASIYAILLFFSIIFQSAGSNIKNLTISLTVPGIGITFALMSLRLHTAKREEADGYDSGAMTTTTGGALSQTIGGVTVVEPDSEDLKEKV